MDNLPLAPGLVEPILPTPQAGEQYMAKPPSVNGQWQPAKIVQTKEGQLVVMFSDGVLYNIKDIEFGGKIQPEATAPAGQTAEVSPLNSTYEQFRQDLVKLNAGAQELFGMPIGPLMIMISRIATQNETASNGKMGTFAGVQMFVPDQETLSTWVEDYLLEIQRREQGASAE